MTDEKRKMVVVDDEKGIRDLFQTTFEDQFHVVVAPNIAEGIACIDKEKPHLLFLDICLPDGNGLEQLPNIRSQFPAMLIVMMTGSGDVGKADKAMKSGANDYITKPFNVNKLQHRTEQLLKIKELEKEIQHFKEGSHEQKKGS